MPLQVTHIHHVGILATNLERSLPFYLDALCLTRKPRPNFGDTGAWFQIAPGQELHVIESEKACRISDDAPTHFALVIENQKEAVKHLDRCNVAYSEPKFRPDGAVQIFVRDPDNHLIELTCNFPE